MYSNPHYRRFRPGLPQTPPPRRFVSLANRIMDWAHESLSGTYFETFVQALYHFCRREGIGMHIINVRRLARVTRYSRPHIDEIAYSIWRQRNSNDFLINYFPGEEAEDSDEDSDLVIM